ncbi:hypothetical protein [Tessaracoccus sp. Z1128]
MTPGRSLIARLAVGVAAAALVILLDDLANLRVDPTLALLAGAVAAAASWALTHARPAPEPPEWQQPSWHTRSPHFQADIRTRRLASVLAHAQPGRGFDSRRVARQLAELTVRRLVTSGRITRPSPHTDPLGDAGSHLSPALLAYLRSAEAEHPQVLNRKTLHAHLKEIDSL